jgi:hypothetical protein
LDEQGIEDKDYSWSIIVLNFEFLLVLNHDNVTWDCIKGGRYGEEEDY